MRVRLAKLKSKMRKPLFQLSEQPLTVGKATDEKCEPIVVNQGVFKDARVYEPTPGEDGA